MQSHFKGEKNKNMHTKKQNTYKKADSPGRRIKQCRLCIFLDSRNSFLLNISGSSGVYQPGKPEPSAGRFGSAVSGSKSMWWKSDKPACAHCLAVS